jgi:hypothetical protein
MFSRDYVKLPPALLARARAAAEGAGYSSVAEFIVHAVEKELQRLEDAESGQAARDQLRGLGYIE